MPHKLSKRTISALQRVITGDKLDTNAGPLAPYLSGPKLVDFFNEYGFNDSYGQGFPSRWAYAEAKLEEINGTAQLTDAIEGAVYPPRFFDTPFEVSDAVAYLNRYLAFDGLELVLSAGHYRLRRLGGQLVALDAELSPLDPTSHDFIDEQLSKCDRKLRDGDYDGAITNARSLVEAVLIAIEARLVQEPPGYDGDLPRLYKRVQKVLNLDPTRTDIADSLRQVLAGLSSIVAGLAPMRNKMGDAHARSYRPERHHAKLAVNAAKTLADFLIETYAYQVSTGRIQPAGRAD